jgi:excisionase family DNA binding protein
MNLLTTPEAAERLGVTVTRVQQLIAAGRLPAQKRGRDYFINEDDLKLIEHRKPGRPSKPKAEGTPAARKRATGRKRAGNGPSRGGKKGEEK